MTVYADSSFFVCLYVAGCYSGDAYQFVKDGHVVWLTPLHRAEAALARAAGLNVL